jgi:hypothetical protein
MKALPRRATVAVPPVAPPCVSPLAFRHRDITRALGECPTNCRLRGQKPAPDHWRSRALAWTDAQGTRAAAPGAATTDSWVKSG